MSPSSTGYGGIQYIHFLTNIARDIRVGENFFFKNLNQPVCSSPTLYWTCTSHAVRRFEPPSELKERTMLLRLPTITRQFRNEGQLPQGRSGSRPIALLAPSGRHGRWSSCTARTDTPPAPKYNQQEQYVHAAVDTTFTATFRAPQRPVLKQTAKGQRRPESPENAGHIIHNASTNISRAAQRLNFWVAFHHNIGHLSIDDLNLIPTRVYLL